MEKGDFIEITIEDLSNEGNGIGHTEDGMTVFVEGAVVSDRVRVGISQVKKNYALGKAVTMLEKSPLREDEDKVCPYIDKCGGCSYGKLRYEEQLKLKEKSVKDKLERLGGVSFIGGDDKEKVYQGNNESSKVAFDHSSSKKAVIKPIISMDNPYNYRNKATISVFDDLVGFNAKKSNMVVDCENCMIQSESANQAAWALRSYIATEKIQGVFNKMVVKTTSLDECMVALYTNSFMAREKAREQERAAKQEKYTKNEKYRKGAKYGKSGSKGAQKADSIKKFDINTLDLEKLAYGIDDAVENTLESIWIDDQLIAGKKTILDQAGNLQFEISPLSFYQTNHEQMIKLYDKVVEYADLKKGSTILDLYCGVGTIGLYMIDSLNRKLALEGQAVSTDIENCGASSSLSLEENESDASNKTISGNMDVHDNGMVIGIESCKPAVIDANRNAVINHIVNARYVAGKAEEELPFMMGMTKLYKPNEVNEMVERTPEIKIEHADCVVLDPPRAGCDRKLLEAVVKAQPDRIVYVSCDPGTLARDVKFLAEGVTELGYSGYELKEVTPVDMFPHTAHVETVVCLSKKNTETKKYVEIDVDADDYYKIKDGK